MIFQQTSQKLSLNPFFRAVLLCVVCTNVFAADLKTNTLQLLDHDNYRDNYRSVNTGSASANPRATHIHPGTPLILEPVSGAFEFDLAGSDIPKLQLQLDYPLQFQNGPSDLNLNSSSLLGIGAALTMPLSHGFSVQSRSDHEIANPQYHAVGNIQCLNGTLKPDSYTASGCRFVDDQPVAFDRRTLSLGASQELGAVSSSITWFTSQFSSGQVGLNPGNRFNQAPVFDPTRYSTSALESILPGMSGSSLLQSEAQGVDLNFQVGFTTDQAGEVQLGLALTRVYDAQLNSLSGEAFTPLSWNEAEPFSAASLGIEWKRGAFSSGVRGYYREQIDFLDRQSLDSLGTFDVHFTWRAPWNASFSVGASNVLGAGTEEVNAGDKPVNGTDRFESIYGRIPYVRYQQDL